VNVELPTSGIEGAVKSSTSKPDSKSARRGRAASPVGDRRASRSSEEGAARRSLQSARTDREAA
jgi:hypothetical protein